MSKRSLTILITIMFLACVSTATAEKNEVVYVNLSSVGDVDGVYVVNRFDYDRPRDIVDYGEYSSVVNLTDLSSINRHGDSVEFSMPAGTFYYQGNAVTRDIPWTFKIGYKLDGKDVAPENLAGKSGAVEITISIGKNDKANAAFFDNYLLSMSATLDGDVFSNVSATDATIANSGKDKLITWTILPGNEKTYSVTAYAKGFEMGAISINGVPFSLDIGEVDTSAIKDRLGDLKSGITKIDKGADKLNTATKQLFEGTDELYSGSVAMTGGIVELKAGSDLLETNSGNILSAVNMLSSAFGQLKEQAAKIKNGGKDLAAGADKIKEGLAAVDSALSALEGESDSMLNGITALSQSAGSCSGEIALIKTLISKGEQNADVKTYLSKEIAAMKKIIATVEGLDDGLKTLKSGYAEFDAALSETAKSLSNLKTVAEPLSESILSYASGVGKISDAVGGVDLSKMAEQYKAFDDGVKSLNSAIGTLKTSYDKIHTGIKSIHSGADKLQSGAKKLDSGTGTLSGETKNIDKKVDDEVDKTLSKYTGTDFTSVSFVDRRNDVELVQFVIKTDIIELLEQTEDDEVQQDADMSFADRFWALFK